MTCVSFAPFSVRLYLTKKDCLKRKKNRAFKHTRVNNRRYKFSFDKQKWNCLLFPFLYECVRPSAVYADAESKSKVNIVVLVAPRLFAETSAKMGTV